MFVSVVSHGHASLIIRQNILSVLAKKNKVIVTDNIGEEILKNYCFTYKIEYICNISKKGFGENNNQNFTKAKKLGMKEDDIFLILNPDVVVKEDVLDELSALMLNNKSIAATINLQKTNGATDNNIRSYPSLIDFIGSYLSGKNKTIIDKKMIDTATEVDWASGSFIAIDASTYDIIHGFDEKYFMYCEDLDFCKRIYDVTGKKIMYYPQLEAIHYAAHQNRNLMSKHFFWHIRSVFRYCFISSYKS